MVSQKQTVCLTLERRALALFRAQKLFTYIGTQSFHRENELILGRWIRSTKILISRSIYLLRAVATHFFPPKYLLASVIKHSFNKMCTS